MHASDRHRLVIVCPFSVFVAYYVFNVFCYILLSTILLVCAWQCLCAGVSQARVNRAIFLWVSPESRQAIRDSFTLFLVLTVFHLAWSLGHTLRSSSHPTRMQNSRELLLRWNVQGSPGDLTNPVVLLRSGYQKPPGGQQRMTRKRGRRGDVDPR